jgi:hypothetical protein
MGYTSGKDYLVEYPAPEDASLDAIMDPDSKDIIFIDVMNERFVPESKVPISFLMSARQWFRKNSVCIRTR